MDRQLVRVEWYAASHRIDLTYDIGESTQMIGDRSVALAIAHNAGLHRVTGEDEGVDRWGKVQG